ncbi:MAG: GDYXXLXY domain-containing protein [Saprospiraceae bacterium]|nr:MAG: hypothetical protein UZ09_BCD002002183 [Bacteroidetes bacterium OLB9]MCO6462720.1 GDYXXLXY domain-containing protein [Saprospiraceae bacterium]MCZ2340020.1 GDYXXLXY domain-containing protein [Chitinophagales bacterium]
MKNKQWVYISFLLMAILQISLPLTTIINKNQTMTRGTLYKFKVKPLDPAHPFIGRYVDLSFEQDTFKLDQENLYQNDQVIYIEIVKDDTGFAKIQSIATTPFDHTPDYIRAKVSYVSDHTLYIKYPFSHFYMEESKALLTEEEARKAMRDANSVVYAEVMVMKGDAVIKDLKINEISVGHH